MSNKYAILVGVSEYQDSITPLPYAYNDVYRMGGLLKFGGFSPNKIFILANPNPSCEANSAKPVLENILRVVKQVATMAKSDDLIVLYMAGHAVDIFSKPYFLASDSNLDFLLNSSVNMTELLNIIKSSRCNHVIRIFDICRQHFAKDRSLISTMTTPTLDLLLDRVTGHATFVSCSAGEYALESPDYKQGVASYFINNNLSQHSDDSLGYVTWDMLSESTVDQVREWCAMNHAVQNPKTVSNYNGPAIVTFKLKTAAEKNENEKPKGLEEKEELIPNPSQIIQTLYHKNLIRPVKQQETQSEKNFDQALALLLKVTDLFIREFSHPSISVFRTEPVKLSILSYLINQEFERYLYSLDTEQVQQTMGLQIFFRHSLAFAPNTSLYLNLVRFSDHYWIWYCLPFETLRSSGEFTPANPIKIDVIALRDPSIFDQAKLERHISDIFVDCTETIIEWVRQMHDHMSKG